MERPLRALPRHLSPGLTRVARATQALRLVVDTPIRRSRDPLLSDLPWVRRQHCDEYDAAIVDLRRALWDWMLELRALDDDELRLLREMGLSLRPFRRLLYFEIDRTDDTWEEVIWPTRPDLDSVARLLGTVMDELDRFEAALMTVSSDPYRAVS